VLGGIAASIGDTTKYSDCCWANNQEQDNEPAPKTPPTGNEPANTPVAGSSVIVAETPCFGLGDNAEDVGTQSQIR
jgi:hypothetical protein